MTDSKSSQAQDCLIVQEQESSILSRWEAIAIDISNATQESGEKIFDYRDKRGEKAARSWIAQLRKIKASVERARKEAKAVHLERGRKVDETAKLLTAAVQGLIDPHEAEIKLIEEEEKARVDAHKAVLARIEALADGIETSQEASLRLEELEAIDVSCLEEFSAAGQNRKAENALKIQELGESLLKREAEQAELRVLRAAVAQQEKEVRCASWRAGRPETGASTTESAPNVEKASESAQTTISKRLILINELCEAIAKASPTEDPAGIAIAIADGTLHQAIVIDWGVVSADSEDSIPW